MHAGVISVETQKGTKMRGLSGRDWNIEFLATWYIRESSGVYREPQGTACTLTHERERLTAYESFRLARESREI